jgi:type IV pilus assembly protein PilC
VVLGRVSKKQLTQFTRQLATLQNAGLPVVRSLRVLEEELEPCILKNDLVDVAEDVENGSTFSEALGRHPRTFDRLYVNMVKAGEVGGVMDTILARLADFMEKAQKLKRRVVGAMVYPATVITVAVLIVAGILVFVIPRFVPVFDQLVGPGKLPLMTRALVSVSRGLASYWYLVPGLPLAAWLALRAATAFPGGRRALDAAKLRMPLVGAVVRKTTIARFARTLGTLLASGVSILDAFAIVRDATSNSVFARAIGHVLESIRSGDTIAGSLRETRTCGGVVVSMIDVGEQTGELDRMLLKIADNYDDEVDAALEGMVSALEPLMIVVLGVTIGSIVIALFLPIVEIFRQGIL